MKKLLALLIASALVVTLMASCNCDGNQTSSEEPANSSATATLTEDALGDIINEAAELGDGSAGISLKRTELAGKIASYAAMMGFREDSVESLKKDLEEKINALEDEKKANVNASFMDSFEILDKAIDKGDFDSVKDQFEDAGVADEIETVLKAPGLRDSYYAFKSAYLTMGNSDK